jgi:hypothetical protein
MRYSIGIMLKTRRHEVDDDIRREQKVAGLAVAQ